MYALAAAKKEIFTALKKALGKKFPLTADMLMNPPKPEYGDVSFACFALAKGMGRNPAEIAAELAAKIGASKYIKEVKSAGPYVNFYFSESSFNAHVLTDVSKSKARYGKSTTGKGKKILVEYANLNTHKEVHVGHLRNLSLGLATVRLLRMNGYDVVPVSYINDLGNNVARCLWGIEKLHPNEEPEAGERLNFLGKVYTEATNAIGDNQVAKDEVSDIQRQLEAMSGQWLALWKKTHKWSMDGLKEVFAEFELELDRIYLEHELIDETHAIIKKLLTEGLAKVSEGAVIVDLEAQHLGINLLRKTDGTLLYNAKDLALAYKKEDDYHADRSVYVVDARQSLAMQQLAATLKIIGFPRDVFHLSYDFVTLPEGAMSSRKGNIVPWSDLREAMFTKLSAATIERHADWSARKVAANARALTMASVKFAMLKNDPDKVLTFNMEEAMAHEGFSAPYILYTIARISTLLKKADLLPEHHPEFLTETREQALLRLVAKFPAVIQEAGASFNPSHVAQYAFELAQEFAGYYESIHILADENHDRLSARLELCNAVRQTLTNAMSTLGITVVKEM